MHITFGTYSLTAKTKLTLSLADPVKPGSLAYYDPVFPGSLLP